MIKKNTKRLLSCYIFLPNSGILSRLYRTIKLSSMDLNLYDFVIDMLNCGICQFKYFFKLIWFSSYPGYTTYIRCNFNPRCNSLEEMSTVKT
jgi:hypothetical protein